VGSSTASANTAHTVRLPSTPFAVDLTAGCLRKDGAPIRLRPKTWRLLALLIRRPGELVTKSEILEEIWEGSVVAEEVISVSVRELRRAFGEQSSGEQFIQTVHGRGYRFLPPTLRLAALDAPPAEFEPFISRQREVSVLRSAFNATQLHGRQMVVIGGEAGAGKTAIVQQFLRELETNSTGAVVATGQCIDELRDEEPFGPMIEIFTQLGRSAIGTDVLGAIRRHARTWLLQLPSLITEAEHTTLRQKLTGETREHRVQNLVQAVDGMCEQHTVVMVVEDLHWAGPAMVDLIHRLATRSIPSHLLLICTHRPEQADARGHSFARLVGELTASRRCHSLEVPRLNAAEIDEYIHKRFGGASISAPLRQWFYRQTDGNPLFMVNLADELVHRRIAQDSDEGWVVDANSTGFDDIPESLRSIIEHRCSHLSATDRLVLEAASIVGVRFADEAVQAAVGTTTDATERLATLARKRHMIMRAKDDRWPDGTVVTTYAFRHSLYRDALRDSIPARRRSEWHRRVGLRLESAYASEPIQIGADLVRHFDRGLDPLRSATYLAMLGADAVQRFAYLEATEFFSNALHRIESLPNCTAIRLFLLKARGAASLGTTGYATPESGDYLRAVNEVVEHFGNDLDRGWVLGHFAGWHALRGEHNKSVPLAEQLIEMAERTSSDQFYLWARFLACVGNAWNGNVTLSIEHYRRGRDRFDELLQERPDPNVPPEAKIIGMCGAALATSIAVDPQVALELIDEAYHYSHNQVRHDFGTLLTMWLSSVFHAFLGNVAETRLMAQRTIEGAERSGLPPFVNLGRIGYAWTQVRCGELEAIAEMESAWRDHESLAGVGATISLMFLAHAYESADRLGDARATLQRALELAEINDELLLQPELVGCMAQIAMRERPNDKFVRRDARAKLAAAHAFARERGMNLWVARTEQRLRDLGSN